jgi:ketosteroid isomerase-like protein
MRRFVLAAFALIVLAGCQSRVGPLTDEDIAALNALRAAYRQAAIEGTPNALSAVYAEDAVVWSPNKPAIEGRDAIRAINEPTPGVTIQHLALSSIEIDGYGDLAFDRGTYSFTVVTDEAEEPISVVGKYLVIARKQADGTWLWTLDMSNTDAP